MVQFICKFKICNGIGNNVLTLYFILKVQGSFLGNVNMYKLHIGFNTTNILMAHFYFLCVSPLTHYQLWGSIIKIKFEENSGTSTG